MAIANDPQILRLCIEQHDYLVANLSATLGPQNFSTILDFLPVPSYFSDISVQKGGNMLGVERNARNESILEQASV